MKIFFSFPTAFVLVISALSACGENSAQRTDSSAVTPDRAIKQKTVAVIAPTFLELAGADMNAHSEREGVEPITGRSFAAMIRGEEFLNARDASDVLGREHGGNGAIRKGDWKLLWVGNEGYYQGVKRPGPPPMSGMPMEQERFDRGSPAGTPIGNGGPWKLYNLKEDPAERTDLSEQHPDIVQDLLAEWVNYVAEYGVIVKSGEGETGN